MDFQQPDIFISDILRQTIYTENVSYNKEVWFHLTDLINLSLDVSIDSDDFLHRLGVS